MKHAGPAALATISDLLEAIRERTVLTERRSGIFYCKGVAFLHFHEDPAGLFADLRDGRDFRRIAIGNAEGRAALLSSLDEALAAWLSASRRGPASR